MKKKILYLTSCLFLVLCCVLAVPTAASAASTTYQSISPFIRGGQRDKVGGRYFFTTYNSDTYKTSLRCSTTSTGSGYLIASFDSAYTKDELTPIPIVTNGDIVYYVSTGNVLYKYDAVNRVKTKVKILGGTFKSRLSCSDVSVYASALYGDTLYLTVHDLDNYADYYIYAYDLNAGTLTRKRSLAKGMTTNGRYLIYKTRFDKSAYRYDMKTGTSKCLVTGMEGISAATYQSKLYLSCTKEVGEEGSLLEISYSDASVTTLKTFSYEPDVRFCYNGYIYYSNPDSDSRYRLNISTGVQSTVSTTTFFTNIFKAGSAARFDR